MATPSAEFASGTLDQRLFALDPDAWRAFNRVLDNPPPPNARLKALMARKPPWPE